jgi:hypothetical protein
MADEPGVQEDPDRHWNLQVRETFHLHIPLRDDHAWTAIAREPLAAEWEGPVLDKSFPTNAECARAVLVSVVEQGPQVVVDWRGANAAEREQLAERVAVESEIFDLLRHGRRPITDEERSDTVRAAKALTTTVLDRIAAAANSH